MSWLAILLFVLQHVPDVIEIVKKIIELIRGLPRQERAQARQDLSNAIQSGDHDNVRAVAHLWHKRCTGVGCPADLVGEQE